MFYRSPFAKRVIAALGVLLTAISCMQQTHAICGLWGCIRLVPDKHVAEICCHGCRCTETFAQSEKCNFEPQGARDHCLTDAGGQPGKSCPPNCSCRQAPTPHQAPSSGDGDLAPQPSKFCRISPIVALLDSTAYFRVSGINDLTAQRAIDACARLCRFLS